MEPTPTTPEVKTSYGTLVVLLLIVAVIVFGAFYVLKERIASDEAIESLTEQSDSTDPAAIEQDLSATPPEDFEQDLDQAFVELDAAFEGEAQ